MALAVRAQLAALSSLSRGCNIIASCFSCCCCFSCCIYCCCLSGFFAEGKAVIGLPDIFNTSNLYKE